VIKPVGDAEVQKWRCAQGERDECRAPSRWGPAMTGECRRTTCPRWAVASIVHRVPDRKPESERGGPFERHLQVIRRAV
jgi:hypothetical protein